MSWNGLRVIYSAIETVSETSQLNFEVGYLNTLLEAINMLLEFS